MHLVRFSLLGFVALFLTPLALHAIWWLSNDTAVAWGRADWSSARLLPPANAVPGAMVLVYAARTGRWKGIFAHHSWVVIKERGADAYTRFDKVAWGRPVKIDNWAPDARWYGHRPTLVGGVTGSAAEALIPKIGQWWRLSPQSPGRLCGVAGAQLQFVCGLCVGGHTRNRHRAAADGHRQGLALADLLPGLTPSPTGVAIALGGVLGVTVGWVEGIEVNVLGLVTGIDVRRPALKIPGFGRIGIAP